ncbi:DNA polymerase IV [Oleidesulfovibrio sp.]|uniref:DNA polymerase IV n=1 Tax=Oleidesulfovibrio sp. TaxID=2909707 RepID=UPI003A879E88
MSKWQRCIMHIDMDAFFASVEQLDNPELRGKPVIVGGGKRGVVAAASYEARRYGVRSAMPSWQAQRLCPRGIFVKGRMHRYKEVSAKVMAVLGGFSPVVEQASVDEAYLDATGCERLFGPPEEMAQRIRVAVRQTTGLSCSVGVAPVKFLAKIASDVNKPDGLFVLPPEAVADFLAQLPVGSIPGVGKRFVDDLKALGIRTAGDVGRYPESFWQRRFGKGGISLFARAQGIDSRPVEPYTQAKSESAENTFEEDTDDKELLKTWLLRQAERVGRNQRRMGLNGRTVTLKVKFADFKNVTRSRTLPEPTSSTRVIYETAAALLDELDLPQKVRLIGVGLSQYAQGPQQMSLPLATPDVERDEKNEKLEKAMDALRDKFGSEAIVRGRLFGFKKK